MRTFLLTLISALAASHALAQNCGDFNVVTRVEGGYVSGSVSNRLASDVNASAVDGFSYGQQQQLEDLRVTPRLWVATKTIHVPCADVVSEVPEECRSCALCGRAAPRPTLSTSRSGARAFPPTLKRSLQNVGLHPHGIGRGAEAGVQQLGVAPGEVVPQAGRAALQAVVVGPHANP